MRHLFSCVGATGRISCSTAAEACASRLPLGFWDGVACSVQVFGAAANVHTRVQCAWCGARRGVSTMRVTVCTTARAQHRRSRAGPLPVVRSLKNTGEYGARCPAWVAIPPASLVLFCYSPPRTRPSGRRRPGERAKRACAGASRQVWTGRREKTAHLSIAIIYMLWEHPRQ